jgi:hypothetical protein
MSKVAIRGISGWTTRPKCEAENEAGERCRKDAGHDGHAFPEPRMTPEEALAAIKKAAAEGKVVMANSLPGNRGGFTVQWDGDEGFGELTVWMNPDGSIEIDDECSSRQFLADILASLLENGRTLSEKNGQN